MSEVDPQQIYRTPEDRFSNLPDFDLEPRYLDLEGDLTGLRMAYVEAGEGDPILLVHGEPSWSFLYRKMIGRLSEVGRVIAPDLIGFGRSDKVTDRQWYSYDRHTDALTTLVRALDLTRVTVVVQDWGGPIGLRVATQERDRFERLVILNTGVYRSNPNWPSPGFLAWRQYAEENPDLPVGDVLQGGTTTTLTDEVIRAYEAPFEDESSKAAAAVFPLLVPLGDDSPGAAEMIATADAVERWNGPVLVAFSDSDPIFSIRSGQRLAERIPGARFVPIEGASHFLQEDKGEELAEVIADFLSS